MNRIDTKSFIQNVTLSNAYAMGGIITREEADVLNRLYLLKAISSNFDELVQRYILRGIIDLEVMRR